MKLDTESIVGLLMLVIAFGLMGMGWDIDRYQKVEINSQIATIGK